MSYVIYLISFLVALFGLLFKTTIEEKDTGKKRLNSYGWVVLTLMIAAVLFNLYVNFSNNAQTRLETRNLQLTKTADSLKQEYKARIDAERWNNQKESSNIILAKTNTSLDSLKSYNVLLKTNFTLQEKIALQSESNNSELKARLNDAQKDLIKLKYPINNLYMSVKMNVILDSTLADSVKAFIDSPMNKLANMSLTSMVKEFPKLKEFMQHLYISIDFYRDKYVTPQNSTHTVSYYFNLATIFEKDILIEDGEIIPHLNGAFLLIDFSNFKTTNYSNSTDFESLDELCGRTVVLSVSHTGKTSFVSNKIEVYDLNLSPKKETDYISRGFIFKPTEKEDITHYDDSFEDLVTYGLNTYECLFSKESFKKIWGDPAHDSDFSLFLPKKHRHKSPKK